MMKIAVLVSGGVDSSVALALLKKAGHDVTAFYLKIWLEDELAYLGDCPWQEDLQYVQAVCQQLDVPLEVISLQKEYWDTVVAYTIEEVKQGRTLNPDILCNQRIKFGVFYDKVAGAYDKVATGHYAALSYQNDVTYLVQSPDPIKDQTYFLSHLTQAQLSKALFPIGHLQKHEVRKLAAEFNLPNKERKDSQGICFLGKFKFDEFLRYHLGQRPGDILEIESGKIMGQHQGFWYFTIGQRQGLGLAGGPWYVVSKDTHNNIVFISRSYYADDKKRDTFIVGNLNWIAGQPLKEVLGVKIRHGAHTYQAKITSESPSEEQRMIVVLDQQDQGIAPGQFAAFYDGTICLGSGIIERTLP